MSKQQATPADTQTQQKKTNHKKPLAYNPVSEIVRLEHAPIVTGLSSVTIWRRCKDDDFVPRIQLGKNSVGFRRSDIAAWLSERERTG